MHASSWNVTRRLTDWAFRTRLIPGRRRSSHLDLMALMTARELRP